MSIGVIAASLVVLALQRPENDAATQGLARVTARTTVGGATISLEYRPSRLGDRSVAEHSFRSRKVDALPIDAISRIGDKDSAVFSTDRQLNVAGLRVAPGRYTLFLKINSKTEWLLIFNKSPNPELPFQFGQELGTSAMSVSAGASRLDILAVAFRTTEAGTELVIRWADKSASTPIQVEMED